MVANFAYEVTDLNTGKLIEKFDHPALYSVTDSMINGTRVYWAATPVNPSKLVDVNEASVITKDTMKHTTPAASVR